MRRSKTERIRDFDDGIVIERPDGVYWQDPRSGREYGPFATAQEAIADMDVEDAPEEAEEPLAVGETLEEAQAEMGIAGWVDPDTGEVAEDQLTRLEDH